jgi:hypothetical protein
VRYKAFGRGNFCHGLGRCLSRGRVRHRERNAARSVACAGREALAGPRASAPANPPAAQDHKLSESKAPICSQQGEEAAEAAAELARRGHPRAAGQAGPGLASRGCSLGAARAGRRLLPKTSGRQEAEPSAQGSGGRYGGGGGAERAAGGGG